MRRLFLFILLATVNLAPCSAQHFWRTISAHQAGRIIRNQKGKGELVVLDVRTPGEYARGHLEDAININFWDKGFTDSVAKLDKSRTYLVYCSSGVRSRGAMKKMRSLGFGRVYNLRGGMIAWRTTQNRPPATSHLLLPTADCLLPTAYPLSPSNSSPLLPSSPYPAQRSGGRTGSRYGSCSAASCCRLELSR
jgi:rhodanese-related sulfurtransferase